MAELERYLADHESSRKLVFSQTSEAGYDIELQSGEDPGEDDEHTDGLLVYKLTFNSLATALVDIPAVSMPIYMLPQLDNCGIVLCNKTAHFRVAFY